MAKTLHFLLIFMYIFFSFFFPIIFSDSSVDSFIYGGCSQIKYSPDSPYESNLNSLLTSLVNSATYSSYNKYSIVGSTQQDMINGLVGPSNGFDLDEMGRRDAVLLGLMGGNGLYRVGGPEDVQGMAQCVGDLSMAQCQDCLSEAIGRLKKECGGGVYGDMFLGKCCARYTTKGAHLYAKPNHHDSHSESEKTFALIIGLLAGVALLIILLTIMRRMFGRNGK